MYIRRGFLAFLRSRGIYVASECSVLGSKTSVSPLQQDVYFTCTAIYCRRKFNVESLVEART